MVVEALGVLEVVVAEVVVLVVIGGVVVLAEVGASSSPRGILQPAELLLIAGLL